MKLAFLVLILSGCGCSSLPTHDAIRATTLHLEFAESFCSGTAVGPDLILTAEHCLDGALLKIDGHPVKGTVTRRDTKRDMAWLRITGVRFTHWANRAGKARQGDRVRYWGHPGGVAQTVYREGYVTMIYDGALIVDSLICSGDSGSALWSDDGRIVGVVSAMTDTNGCTFMKAHVP